jgi:hypothetical protein
MTLHSFPAAYAPQQGPQLVSECCLRYTVISLSCACAWRRCRCGSLLPVTRSPRQPWHIPGQAPPPRRSHQRPLTTTHGAAARCIRRRMTRHKEGLRPGELNERRDTISGIVRRRPDINSGDAWQTLMQWGCVRDVYTGVCIYDWQSHEVHHLTGKTNQPSGHQQNIGKEG